MIKKITKYFVCFILACSFTTTAFTNELELTLSEYKTMLKSKEPTELANDFKKYSHLIIKFAKGDIIQMKIDNEFFKTSEKNLTRLEIKEPFLIKMPIGHGDLKISKDNKKFEKINSIFTKSMTLGLENQSADILILTIM